MLGKAGRYTHLFSRPRCRCHPRPHPYYARSFVTSPSEEWLQGRSTSSVSPREVEHFSKLSSSWWDEGGVFKLLHRMNPTRIQFVRERIAWDTPDDGGLPVALRRRSPSRFLEGFEVLDVGCGGGIFSEALARLGGRVLGIDASATNVQVATLHAIRDRAFRQSILESTPSASELMIERGNTIETSRCKREHLMYRHASAEELVREGAQFDVVCAMEVIEHVEDARGFLTSLAELTKPGGHIILSTISRTPLARLLTITLAESPLLRFAPPGTHTYSKYITPHEMTTFFRHDLGWGKTMERVDLEIRGVIYEPWWGEWTLAPRGQWWGEQCNYYLGARKPR